MNSNQTSLRNNKYFLKLIICFLDVVLNRGPAQGLNLRVIINAVQDRDPGRGRGHILDLVHGQNHEKEFEKKAGLHLVFSE